MKRKGEKKSQGLITSNTLEFELTMSLTRNNVLDFLCAFGYPKVTAELVNYHMIDSNQE